MKNFYPSKTNEPFAVRQNPNCLLHNTIKQDHTNNFCQGIYSIDCQMGGPKKIDLRNIKNKSFLKWTRAEASYPRDNLISSDWIEKLEKLPMFVPTYAKTQPNMGYIMSMEYGRMWQKEKDDWFSQIYKSSLKGSNIAGRRKKFRMEYLEAKKKAEMNIKERKEKRAKEAEAKAKAEAEAKEKAKKMKAKLEKSTVKNNEIKNPSENEEKSSDKKEKCPKGYTEVELTIQCECAANKENADQDKKNETEQVKNVEAEQKTVENVPCIPEYIQDQIAKVMQKAQEDEVPKECIKNKEEQE